MWRIETRRALDDDEFAIVQRLLSDAADHDGFRPLSDHLRLEFVGRDRAGFVAILAFDQHDRIGGYAQLARANLSTTIELVIAPDVRDGSPELSPQLLRTALATVASDGGGTVHWWVHRPEPVADVIAAEVGLTLGRRLMQMRRSLPVDETTAVETPGLRGRSRRGRMAAGQQRRVPRSSRAGRLDRRHLAAARGRAMVRSRGLPAPRARRSARRVLLDQGAQRHHAADGRDLRDRRRSAVSRPRARLGTDPRRARTTSPVRA